MKSINDLKQAFQLSEFAYWNLFILIPVLIASPVVGTQSLLWLFIYLLVFCLMFTVVIYRFFCTHCPHYNKAEQTLHCIFFWGFPKYPTGKLGVEFSPILRIILIDPPFGNEVVLDSHRPDCIIAIAAFFPCAIAVDRHKVIPGLDSQEGILIFRERFEELFPSRGHRLLPRFTASFAIDKPVIGSHQAGKSIDVLAIDTFIKQQDR